MSYDPDQQSIKAICKDYAEGTRRTVFFVGAGGSAEVGMPTWAMLRTGLLKKISSDVDAVEKDEEELENYRELEELGGADDKFWDFFSHAANKWPTSYNDFMIASFDGKVDGVDIPVTYRRLWRMRRSRQIFTLNVDALLARSFNVAFPNRRKYQLLEFDGYNVSDCYSYLAKDAFCLINLHGTYHHKSRWIMDADQRKQLHSGSQGAKYGAFISRLFSEYNVVFLGMNPSDVAISPFLKKAVDMGALGNHYWICPSPNASVSRWSQRHGIRLISYSPEKNEAGRPSHSQDICAILDQMDSSQSQDERVNLPNPTKRVDPKSLDGASVLAPQVFSDKISARESLAGAIAHLGDEFGYSSSELGRFLSNYKIPLQFLSTISSDTDGFKEVMKYSIVERLQDSGTSSVWIAREAGDEAEYHAFKALSPDKLDSISIRQSFRRGIESLYLLTQENSGVAPKYIEHSELPLSVVMEFVKGGTLTDFCSAFSRTDQKFTLNLFEQICEAVRSCHQSPGRVLHRDIKPGNIMLEGWHSGYELEDAGSAKVRLINFDLSWHRFTSGDTKSISAEDIGYYAPEQRNSSNSLPPRSAETDVYMLGMVLYYLCSRTAPPDGGAGLSDWPQMVRSACRRMFSDSLVNRRAQRLITDMTMTDMSERIDLSNAISEVTGLVGWLDGDKDLIDDEYIVESMALATGRDYAWDRFSFRAVVSSNESSELSIGYIQKGHRLEVNFFREKSGSDLRGSFGTRMLQRVNSAAQLLEESGWRIDQKSNRGLKAEVRIMELRKHSDFGSAVWQKASDLLLRPME